MFPIPLKLKELLPNVLEINPVLLPMPITSMELTEKSNKSMTELFSSSIEKRDVILSPLNLNLLLDIMKNSNKRE
jgi:hypothetical protein